jgi:DNA-binding transcriptional ArsR family regulator
VKGDVDVAAAAALLAEPARTALVQAVIEDGPLPASELAARAGIAPSTASQHLRRLVGAGFLATSKSGRHRYYRLGEPAVADAIEALAIVAPQPEPRTLREATRGELLREARTCYDHLAGRLGVAVARALEASDVVVPQNGSYAIGPRVSRLETLGIELERLEGQPRPVIRGCLDWSERELHVAGGIGAALAARLFELGWIERREANRSVAVTERGRTLLREQLGVEFATR